MRIVVTEYPKSGGNWVVNMVGDAMGLPKRDIYDCIYERRPFDLRNHPWYEGNPTPKLTDACVIKSHEPPSSNLTDFPASFVHLLRDGRDVVISKYFYERDFCVANGIYERFDTPFDEYVPRVSEEWREYVFSWLDALPSFYKYETFLEDPTGALRTLLSDQGVVVSDSTIRYAVESNSREKMRRSLDKAFKHNTFVRKGIAGDWRNHFNSTHIEVFKELAGDVLIRLGYERDLDW